MRSKKHRTLKGAATYSKKSLVPSPLVGEGQDEGKTNKNNPSPQPSAGSST